MKLAPFIPTVYTHCLYLLFIPDVHTRLYLASICTTVLSLICHCGHLVVEIVLSTWFVFVVSQYVAMLIIECIFFPTILLLCSDCNNLPENENLHFIYIYTYIAYNWDLMASETKAGQCLWITFVSRRRYWNLLSKCTIFEDEHFLLFNRKPGVTINTKVINLQHVILINKHIVIQYGCPCSCEPHLRWR